MSTNPVETNVVTRFLLGFAVIVGMMFGGGIGGSILNDTAVPYGGVVGTALGALAVFLGFVVVYRRYDRSYGETV